VLGRDLPIPAAMNDFLVPVEASSENVQLIKTWLFHITVFDWFLGGVSKETNEMDVSRERLDW
jgi:hypothetical protein